MANSKATFRPPTFKNLPARELADAVDAHLPRLFDMHSSLNATAIKGPRYAAGFATNAGNEIITGSKFNIPTGLSKVNFVVASVSTGLTPNAYTLSAQPSAQVPGSINILVFQPTAAGNTTPTAATAAVLVHWVATGEAETTT